MACRRSMRPTGESARWDSAKRRPILFAESLFPQREAGRCCRLPEGGGRAQINRRWYPENAFGQTLCDRFPVRRVSLSASWRSPAAGDTDRDDLACQGRLFDAERRGHSSLGRRGTAGAVGTAGP